MEWMAEEAIMLTGQYDKGLQRMKQRYESQVNMEWLTTLYEKYQPELRGTYNHAWNAPNYVLSRYIAGIKPTDVAWSNFEVKPNLEHLTSVKQIVPSVKGDITLEVNKTENMYTMNLISPKETTATLYIPKTGNVFVNEQLFWKKGKLKKQIKGIEYESESNEFLKFKVDSGNWKIVAN